jgi:phosphohistidine phosphatase SixA
MDLVLTSDFARGKDTGDFFRPKKARHVALKELRPNVPAFWIPETMSLDEPTAWNAIHNAIRPEDEHVLIVGHGPQIQELVQGVCFTFEPGEKILAHGNMIKIDVSEQHQFHWLMTPRLAAKMLGIEDKTDSDEGHADEMAEQGKDPESLAIDEAVREFFASGLVLTENLGTPNRRAVIDPLVSQLQKALRIRWKAQLKKLETYGLPLLQEALMFVQSFPTNKTAAPMHEKRQVLAVLKLHDASFAKRFRKVTSTAYAQGAIRAQSQLPVTATEAKVKTPPNLPGSDRDPVDLEDELDDTTTDRVGGIIDKAFATPLAYAAMVGLIRDEFQSWAEAGDGKTSRAETVALQEVSTAYHDGGRDFVDDWRGGNGPVEKRWNAEDDACEECLENETEDFIDSEAPHSSGDDEPPAHPNCRCEEEYRAVAVEESLR